MTRLDPGLNPGRRGGNRGNVRTKAELSTEIMMLSSKNILNDVATDLEREDVRLRLPKHTLLLKHRQHPLQGDLVGL
jgi:hypothetical protein